MANERIQKRTTILNENQDLMGIKIEFEED